MRPCRGCSRVDAKAFFLALNAEAFFLVECQTFFLVECQSVLSGLNAEAFFLVECQSFFLVSTPKAFSNSSPGFEATRTLGPKQTLHSGTPKALAKRALHFANAYSVDFSCAFDPGLFPTLG